MTGRPPSNIERGSLAYWVQLMTARGHAPAFARNSQHDKRIVERSTVREWIEAVEKVELIRVRDLAEGPPNEFPDFRATVSGKDISIELTELLHSPSVLKSAAKGGLTFEDVQWTEAHFRTRLQERVYSKIAQLSKNNRRCDFLILHTDEPWLLPNDVKRWLAEEPFAPPKEIGAAYLLMTYVPGWADHWPIFRLWGER